MQARTTRYWSYRRQRKISFFEDLPPDPKATNFEEVINFPDPQNYIRRIDLSHWEVVNDWKAITEAGVTEVYVKVTEGVGTYDTTAKSFAEKAKSLGLKVGYFHFGRPDTKAGGTIVSDATAEADDFLKTVAQLPTPDLPHSLDLEDTKTWDSPLKPDEYLLWLQTFLARIQKPGDPVPYINSRRSYLDVKLPDNHGLNTTYPLWLSRYHIDYNQSLPVKGWTEWAVWQFTDIGRLGAGNTELDLNWVKG